MMGRVLKGVIHGDRFYRIPEDASALQAARRGEKSRPRRATRVYGSKGGGQRSLSLGCHRKDVATLRREIKRRGIGGVSYEPGRHGFDCVMTSERGAEQWMKAFGEINGLGPLHNAGSEGVE